MMILFSQILVFSMESKQIQGYDPEVVLSFPCYLFSYDILSQISYSVYFFWVWISLENYFLPFTILIVLLELQTHKISWLWNYQVNNWLLLNQSFWAKAKLNVNIWVMKLDEMIDFVIQDWGDFNVQTGKQKVLVLNYILWSSIEWHFLPSFTLFSTILIFYHYCLLAWYILLVLQLWNIWIES